VLARHRMKLFIWGESRHLEVDIENLDTPVVIE
jgi:hypothetical protein